VSLGALIVKLDDITDWHRSSPSFSEKLITAREKMIENLPGNE